ncbi:MAG TPA: NAD(P)H-binding protein [Sumerlaeia bacterium]|nr:NAD(P)H-binding protein [Sumerlaeia bacterium]
MNATSILLTGATGHTGQRVAQRLLERGAHLRCLLHTSSHRVRLPDSPKVQIIVGSAASPRDVARAAEGANTVVHLAHIRFAPALIEALSERVLPVRLIALSSTRLFSSFESPARETVQKGEEEVMAAPSHIQWTILRPSMIFGGPSDRNIERLARFMKRSPVLPIFGSGANLVQPLFVWDLVDAIVACLERPATARHTYTLAGPEPMAYRDMVEAVAYASGSRTPLVIPLPLKPSLWFAKALRRIWPGSPLNPEMIERFAEDRSFDISPARRDLDLCPTSFDRALERKFRREV